jgi:hypothetical protein
MLYAAKCYWPGVTEHELERATSRARGRDAVCLGALFFPDDDLVLCLFDAGSATATRTASERAGIPCERVMASRWLARHRSLRRTPCPS